MFQIVSKLKGLAVQIPKVKNVGFLRDKYGSELLIDVAWIKDMPQFEKRDIPYRLEFYDITLITAGSGRFCLDSTQYLVRPGTVFFTSPGQVRRWLVEGLDGLCFFFPAEFIVQHFNDPLFLHRLRYFHSDIGPFELPLKKNEWLRLQERLTTMREEIVNLQTDSPHLLRAIAYEVLINLNRWYAAQHGQTLEQSPDQLVSRYRHAVEEYFLSTHRISDYANMLGLTPGHLNVMCQKYLGRVASDVLQTRVMTEAQRLLVHSDLTVTQVGEYLGYADPSYFSRAFNRVVGSSPSAYRLNGRRSLLGQ